MTPKIFTARLNRLELAFLVLILVLASALRLSHLDLAEFARDQARLSLAALDMVHGRQFPLLGMRSSVGIPFSPMSVYLMAIPYAASDNPMVATGFVAALNITAVGALYIVARRYYGPEAAVISALLYAVNPYAIIYSRSIWEPDLLSLFVIASVGTGILGLLEGKGWAQLLHLPLLSITVQIHYAAFVLVPVSAILVISGRQNLRRFFLGGLVLAIFLAIPFIIGLARSSLFTANSLQNTVASHGILTSISVSNAAIFEAAISIAGNHLLHNDLDVYTNPIAFAALVAAAWLVFRTISKHDARSPIDLALVAWAVVTPIVFTLTWTAVYQHYMVTTLPGGLLLLAVGANDLLQAFTSKYPCLVAWVLGAAYLSLVVIIQVNFTVLAFSAPINGTASLGYLMAVRQTLLTQDHANILVNLGSPLATIGSEQLRWITLLYDIPNVRFQPDGADVYPAEKAVYLSHRCDQSTQSFWLTDGVTCYGVGWRGPNNFDRSDYTPTNQAGLIFASGTQLIGYSWQSARGCLSLVWKVQSPKLAVVAPGLMGRDYQFLVRFYDARKAEILQADSLAWQNGTLKEGDVAVRSFCATGDQRRFGQIVGVRINMITTGGAQTYGQDLFDANYRSIGNWLDKTSWLDISLPTYF